MAMNFVTFNQDYSHLAVGTSRGFRIYTTDPFAKCFETKQGEIALIEMLFSTSLVALVLSPRRLQINNTKRQSTICELTFPTAVLAVRMNRKRLVVVLEDQIYLYDISNMKLLHTIETSPNPNAICALSPSSDNCYLAYPLPQKAAIPMPQSHTQTPAHAPPGSNQHHIPPTSGDVLLFDTLKLEAINVVEAHRSPLSCVTVNDKGTLLATASDKGTIIRVFSLPSARKLYQFRRGSMPSRICSMAFNATSTLLCVSSATETVHIFKLSPSSSNRTDADPSTITPSAATDPSSAAQHHRGSSASNHRPSSASRPSNYFFRGSSEASFNASTTTAVDDDDPASTSAVIDGSYTQGGGSTMKDRNHNGTFLGMIRRTSQNVGTNIAASMGAYLPTAVSEMWEPTRDFAWVKIPKRSATGILANTATTGDSNNTSMSSTAGPIDNEAAPSNLGPGHTKVSDSSSFPSTSPLAAAGSGMSALSSSTTPATATTSSTLPLRSVVALSPNAPQIMVVTNDGHFHLFGIDLEKGGEGTLMRVFEIGSS